MIFLQSFKMYLATTLYINIVIALITINLLSLFVDFEVASIDRRELKLVDRNEYAKAFTLTCIHSFY